MYVQPYNARSARSGRRTARMGVPAPADAAPMTFEEFLVLFPMQWPQPMIEMFRRNRAVVETVMIPGLEPLIRSNPGKLASKNFTIPQRFLIVETAPVHEEPTVEQVLAAAADLYRQILREEYGNNARAGEAFGPPDDDSE